LNQNVSAESIGHSLLCGGEAPADKIRLNQ
jgi:hypothetical protein